MTGAILDGAAAACLPPGFRYLPRVLAPAEEAEHLSGLLAETPWETRTFVIFGRRLEMPRRICMYGPYGYRYSGIAHPQRPLTPRLRTLLARVEAAAGARFNSVLLNHYRDGQDSVSWHSDDDYGHGDRPTIGSLSLGATRRFQLRSKELPRQSHALELDGGSVLVMEGDSQRLWRHQLPRTRRPVGPRVNLTFRWMEGR